MAHSRLLPPRQRRRSSNSSCLPSPSHVDTIVSAKTCRCYSCRHDIAQGYRLRHQREKAIVFSAATADVRFVTAKVVYNKEIHSCRRQLDNKTRSPNQAKSQLSNRISCRYHKNSHRYQIVYLPLCSLCQQHSVPCQSSASSVSSSATTITTESSGILSPFVLHSPSESSAPPPCSTSKASESKPFCFKWSSCFASSTSAAATTATKASSSLSSWSCSFLSSRSYCSSALYGRPCGSRRHRRRAPPMPQSLVPMGCLSRSNSRRSISTRLAPQQPAIAIAAVQLLLSSAREYRDSSTLDATKKATITTTTRLEKATTTRNNNVSYNIKHRTKKSKKIRNTSNGILTRISNQSSNVEIGSSIDSTLTIGDLPDLCDCVFVETTAPKKVFSSIAGRLQRQKEQLAQCENRPYGTRLEDLHRNDIRCSTQLYAYTTGRIVYGRRRINRSDFQAPSGSAPCSLFSVYSEQQYQLKQSSFNSLNHPKSTSVVSLLGVCDRPDAKVALHSLDHTRQSLTYTTAQRFRLTRTKLSNQGISSGSESSCVYGYCCSSAGRLPTKESAGTLIRSSQTRSPISGLSCTEQVLRTDRGQAKHGRLNKRGRKRLGWGPYGRHRITCGYSRQAVLRRCVTCFNFPMQ